MKKEQWKEKIKEIMIKNRNSTSKNKYLNTLSEIAQLREGKIKEGQVYINSLTKIIFIDKLGNEFPMTPKDVQAGGWSPFQSGKINNPLYHMKQLEKIVESKGGKIKSGEIYVNNKTKIIFIDKLGNEFPMTPSSVKSGQWSPYEVEKVRNSKYHMDKLINIVSLKGGKIKKGEIYKNAHTKMTFIDKLGNEFKKRPNDIKNGQWSPYESGSVTDAKYHIDQLEQIVKSKGGSIKKGELYINSQTKMTFIDKLGNEFKASPNNIKKGSWSPYERNHSEHICRQIIEQLYDNTFDSCWQTIKRKGKKNLQLDGYCSDLKIAFEYQGSQHTTGWRKNKKSLICIQNRDNEKRQICLNKGILLLEINYYKKINNISDIILQTINDIKKSYENNNFPIPDFIINFNIETINIDFGKINNSILNYNKLEEIAKSKGGKIKDGEKYINSSTKMIFIDKLGNEFSVRPNDIKRGSWSPYELGKVFNDPKYHMKQLQKIVNLKGGKIKDGEIYKNSKTKMTFIDEFGNEFQMRPNDVKRGHWISKKQQIKQS